MARMSLAQAADLLGISHETLRSQIRHQSLSAKKIGHIWTVTDGEVKRYREESLGNRGNRKNKRSNG